MPNSPSLRPRAFCLTAPTWSFWRAWLRLAAAMGIGWFVFTPLLPMMLSDGVITLVIGSWLATANHAGYLPGVLAWRCPGSARKLSSAGTRHAWFAGAGGHGAAHAGHMALLAMGLGGAAVRLRGVASAVVLLLNIAAWLHVAPGGTGAARAGRADFQRAGPGHCAHRVCRPAPWWPWHHCAAAGWAVFGLLCVWGCVHWCGLWCGLPRGGCCVAPRLWPTPGLGPAARGVLTLAYGLAGLGYIVTANVFAGDCAACCLACWPRCGPTCSGLCWHGCGHGGRPVHARAGGVGCGAGCCWWLICCRPLRLV